MEVSDIAWIESNANPADALTKITSNAVLYRIIDEGIVDDPVGQWVIRTSPRNDS